ncbi:MBL fold metallo-hydrolase [Actinomadura rayongensis]|uniref:MBL fold metallo-hydrolase n=1 Tax=Actinomadura rayongensis TaxID=1429076 RepID=A0A6I4WG07_9ACTN|nr:MBL fold metallo-hydrolase [Actinomadura rayongensis]MXQ67883.1 MBL fold metallo-hydrolase [Actinomadura rayongensis]
MDLPPQRETELADGVVALVHGDGGGGMSNAALLLREPVTVVDTMLLPEMARGIRAALARRGRDAALVVNTHNHADHIGGNAVFAGVRTIAHPRTVASTKAMLGPHLPGLLSQVMPRFAPSLAGWDTSPAEPVQNLADELPDGVEALAFEDAHSAADVALWLPGDRVLLAGDLCFTGVTPLAVHGRIGRWRAALDELIALRPRTVLPGHGPPTGPEALHALADYLDRVLAAADEAHAEGLPAETVAGRFDAGAAAGWLEPGRTLVNIKVALSEKNSTPFQGEHHVGTDGATHHRGRLLEG